MFHSNFKTTMDHHNQIKLGLQDAPHPFDGKYVRLPLSLLKENLEASRHELSALEAFILIISKVKFADREEKVGNQIRTCNRGESYISLQKWSELFNWSKSKTRRYFMKLQENNHLEFESLQNTSRIRVLQYDFYTGRDHRDGQEKYAAGFEDFWSAYHQLTELSATDKHAAYKVWKGLSKSEQEKARKKIQDYYFSLSNTRFCSKALTYLKNKKFNDEFYDPC